jgi:hypothetical protein
MCQLTGETDFETRKPAFNTTGTQYHLYGTDLGSSFEHNGRLWFLFGDTWPVPAKGNPRPDGDGDSIAWTINAIPEPGIHLQFVNDAGRYRSPKLIAADGGTISTAGFEVPVAGFSTGPQMYIIYTTHSIRREWRGGRPRPLLARPQRQRAFHLGEPRRR